MPDSGETFAHKKAATLVDDAIDFHGAKLRVTVQLGSFNHRVELVKTLLKEFS